jgi:predicted nucleic acid-binding protein
LILVDSSVWIDFLSSSPSPAGFELRRMIADAEPFSLTGVVATEVLQGLKYGIRRIEKYLSQWHMLEPIGFATYREAAAIFRAARADGVTLTTIDALIAAIALEHNAALFTLDKDFSRLAGIIRFAALCVLRNRLGLLHLQRYAQHKH